MCLLVNCIIYVSTLLSLRVYKPNNPSVGTFMGPLQTPPLCPPLQYMY
jgi:hypothetical protein